MRDDFLVSICIVEEDEPGDTVPHLVRMHEALAQDFRYFEIVYVVGEQSLTRANAFADHLAQLTNLRILIISQDVGFYRKRAIAASEAIGDVVAIVDLVDISQNALSEYMAAAHDRNRVMLGWRSSGRGRGVFYTLLSLASRNTITAQAARTIIFPREQLNAILAQRQPSVDLRFEPRSRATPYERFSLAQVARRSLGFKHRYELLTEILLSGAPRYLKAYAGLGLIGATGAGLYALYALGIVMFRQQVQEGWFSTVIILSGSMFFISLGMSMVAIALVAILERVAGGSHREIIDEMANTSFFDQLTDRNVDTGIGSAVQNLTGEI